ncbi:hypothetical protein PVAP13_9KG613901 [Panicum virgatum]|uniref:Uncharacterized protein n=1 Tax=Panicum virgatum TaxID=38727 RepID=A0A8T0P114_PANVG|nr:hypothetical protein PVAP13_9KG613901 [Panicum virgatum]
MEFHLGGRHWLDLVPTNRTSTDLVSNQPSSDDGSACGPSSNGDVKKLRSRTFKSDCLSSSFPEPLCNNSWKNFCDKVTSTNIPCHIDWFCY